MGDVRYFSRNLLKEFIELYKSLPCLWKIGSKDYVDRNKKSDAYELLADKLREVDPTADRNTVVRRINSLRSSWRKEMKKVAASKNCEDVYKPRLWYFELFTFLNTQKNPNTFETINKTLDFEFEEVNLDIESPKPEEDSHESLLDAIDPLPNYSKNRILTANTPNMKRLRPCDDEEEIKHKIHSCTADPPAEDRYDMIGRNVATKLREIPNKQRIFAEKLINDVLFEAELGSLNRNYVLSVNNSGNSDKL